MSMTVIKMDVFKANNADRKLRELKILSDWDRICKDCLKPNLMHDGRTKCNKEDQDDPLMANVENRAKFQAEFEVVMQPLIMVYMQEKYDTLENKLERETNLLTEQRDTAVSNKSIVSVQRSKPPKWIKGVPIKSHCTEIKRFYDENKQGTDNFKFSEMIKELKNNRDIEGLQEYVIDVLDERYEEDGRTIVNLIKSLKEKFGRTRLEEMTNWWDEIKNFKIDRSDDGDKIEIKVKKLLNTLNDLKVEVDNEMMAVFILDAVKQSKIADIVEVDKMKDIIERGGNCKEMLT